MNAVMTRNNNNKAADAGAMHFSFSRPRPFLHSVRFASHANFNPPPFQRNGGRGEKLGSVGGSLRVRHCNCNEGCDNGLVGPWMETTREWTNLHQKLKLFCTVVSGPCPLSRRLHEGQQRCFRWGEVEVSHKKIINSIYNIFLHFFARTASHWNIRGRASFPPSRSSFLPSSAGWKKIGRGKRKGEGGVGGRTTRGNCWKRELVGLGWERSRRRGCSKRGREGGKEEGSRSRLTIWKLISQDNLY